MMKDWSDRQAKPSFPQSYCFPLVLLHSLQVKHPSPIISLPLIPSRPYFLSAEVISPLFYIICHHQRGWICLQYLVAVQFPRTGRMIDLLLCFLMKETTFVLAASAALVLLNHLLSSVSICYH